MASRISNIAAVANIFPPASPSSLQHRATLEEYAKTEHTNILNVMNSLESNILLSHGLGSMIGHYMFPDEAFREGKRPEITYP